MRSSRQTGRWIVFVAAMAAAITVLAQEAPPPEQPAAEPAAGSEPEKIEFPDAPDASAPTPKPADRKPTATEPAATEPAAPAPGAPPAAADKDEDEPPPDTGPRTPGVVGPTERHFEPTEKVRPDFDVSFPVDI